MSKIYPVKSFSFNEELPDNNFYFTKSTNLKLDFPLHSHDYFEIEIIASGQAETVFNGKNITLSRGSAHILSPTDVHDLKIIKPLEIYKLMLLSDWVSEKMLYELMNNLGTVKFSEEELENIIPILELIIKESSNGQLHQKELICNLLSSLIIFFSRKQKIHSKTQPDMASATVHIKKAVNYILLNYINNISSDDVAKAVNLNPVYFCTLFHKTTGVTFINYLNDLRLNRARQLLMLDSYSVSDVCYACGFNSSSNFLRAFKKKYGYSPNTLKTSYKTSNRTKNSS